MWIFKLCAFIFPHKQQLLEILSKQTMPKPSWKPCSVFVKHGLPKTAQTPNHSLELSLVTACSIEKLMEIQCPLRHKSK